MLAEWKPPVYDPAGIRLITSSIRRNSPQSLDSQIHHNNLLNNILAKIEADAAGVDDAVMLDLEGFVAETNATNIFLVERGVLVTPIADRCLPGITRRVVLEIAREAGIPTDERRVAPAELRAADEAFTTGTMGELSPVLEIDGLALGDGGAGPLTRRLQGLFRQRTAGRGRASAPLAERASAVRAAHGWRCAPGRRHGWRGAGGRVGDVPRTAAQQEYEDRLRLREAELSRLDRRDRRLGNARVAAALLALAAVWPVLIRQSWSLWWLAAPAAAFVALVAAHGPIVAALGRLRLGVAFYRRGLARMAGEWGDPLDDGARFQAAEHPYAEDLDLFGPGSLYALLCTAHSLPGRDTLAGWLAGAAAPAEIEGRQAAAAELAGRLDLQEGLAVLAADLSPEIGAERLDRWGGEAPLLGGLTIPLVAVAFAVLNC